MAIDFPASPAVGQLFNASNGGTYQWTGTLWLPIGNTTATIYVGDTPPPSPIANQFWFNSALGQTFLWYNDGNTTQWVPANPSQTIMPTWQLLQRQTTAGAFVNNLDFTIPSWANHLQFFYNLSINADNNHVHMRIGVDGGAIDAGASYGAVMTGGFTNISVGGGGFWSASTAMFLTYYNSGVTASASYGIKGHCEFIDIQDATTAIQSTFSSVYVLSGATMASAANGGSIYQMTGKKLTSVRFFAGAGQIKGTVSCYGMV